MFAVNCAAIIGSASPGTGTKTACSFKKKARTSKTPASIKAKTSIVTGIVIMIILNIVFLDFLILILNAFKYEAC